MESKWVFNPFHAWIEFDESIMHFPSAPAYFIATNNQWTDELEAKGVTVRQVVPCASLTIAKMQVKMGRVVPWLGKGVVVTKPPRNKMGVVYRVVTTMES